MPRLWHPDPFPTNPPCRLDERPPRDFRKASAAEAGVSGAGADAGAAGCAGGGRSRADRDCGHGLPPAGGGYHARGVLAASGRGRDAITEVPANRWDVDAFYDPDPDAPGKMVTRCGGFVDEVERFDAHFFGISPREAITLDPQQRLLLEVSCEALEDAGMAPDGLSGSRAGVFVGICGIDYSKRITRRDPRLIDAYIGTGNGHSVAAGRLSYFFGLRGPSVAIDTACSSSLVGVHLACQSLRAGECDLALAGGVNLLLDPELSINFSKAHMLAPDGRCKTFDAAADGYVRGEGAGMVVLKRLSDALADGDRILAVIRGSAVNQDGRSSGLTVPNGPAQQDVIRRPWPPAGLEARADRLPGGPRHGHRPGRPDRSGGAGSRVRRRGAAAGGRFGQDQHRPPGGGGRDRRADQGGPGPAPRADPAAPALSTSPARKSPGTSCRCRCPRRPALARGERSPPGGRQLVRLQRHQRPRGARRSAAARGRQRSPSVRATC